ncbi:cation-translocating P-type ATPase [Methylobacter tundripaludum]|uniref:ATPase, P-type (Transporting), HAD superfamily, subfamily IC n=1 Tax=Methylobacter tundripaludum (strain ATCC BAA-1195 / DSM 17260 / SV96) TaxID=697282 RepID=G3J2A9_METTV|nr:cation-transporting P-type ATPase [Methylobacter tundripaludum]EGW19865.1 ATPase, P-type (transporting), HAD superfamily, subfamily IC [Methylobacter tundripaludum SV96]
MKIHQFTADEALASLKTSHDGLSQAEVEYRLDEYGPNRVEEVRGESLIFRFIKEFIHFFALILWLAAGLAFFAESQQPGGGMATLGYAILGVILINGLFSFWQQYRAERALSALQKLLPYYVKVLREGKAGLILAADLVPGDAILLQEGDNVPADCRLLEAFSLRVNNATVTGESLPQARDAEPSAEENLEHSRNTLLAGTSVVSGEGRAVVFATGMHTEFGKIAHLTQTAVKTVSPLQLEIVRLSRLIALISVSLGVAFFLIGRSMGLSFWENFIFAIGIIVANVPEGLLPTVTLSLAMATQRMAKRNALIRHMPSVEALGSATVICTDKTGTLTENRMAVSSLYLGGKIFATTEVRRQPQLALRYRRFFEDALLCHNLKETMVAGKWQSLGDPMEIALVRMAKTCLGETCAYPKINEVPFDTDRKRLSTIHQTPKGVVLYCKGALEMVLPLCKQVQTDDGITPLTAEIRQDFIRAQEQMANKGLRVLAFAWRELEAEHNGEAQEQDLILCALVGLEDPPRAEVPEAMRKCREAGIKVIMVTGDHPHTALAIGRQIGQIQTDNPVVITGEQLRKLSETQLRLALDAPDIIFARVGADQKMRIVAALKKKKHIVAVTGDGVNDAPALKLADIGIAMGISGTDVAKEAADMILLDDNFASIIAAVEEGRAVYENIRKFLAYILTSNIPEVIPYLAFALFKIPLPLTIIQILAVDLGTDMLPALGLGAARPEPGSMSRPPRPRNERLLDWRLLLRAYLFLGMLEAVVSMAAYFFVLHSGGWRWGESLESQDPLYLQATTACLSAIIVTQIVNVFLCKTPERSVFGAHLFDNRIILWGIALEAALILIIDYTAWGNLVFGTLPIAPEVWLFILPFGLAMLLLEELRKFMVVRLRR